MPKQTEIFKQAQKELAERIRKNRPNIAESSIKTYVSILSNLFYKAHERTEPIDLAFFKNEKRIMELLQEKSPTVRKTILAAIVVLNGKEHKHEMLEKQMKDDAEESDRITATQTKSEKQKDNWIDYSEVKQLQNTYELEAMKLLNGKGKLNNDEHELLTKYLILSMSSGVYFPPRRSEMVTIKLENIDKEKDNYIDLAKNQIVYNAYKTSKKYGEQRIEFPVAFKTILKKYLAKVKGQPYLLQTNGKQMTPQQLTRELNAIFGKRISTSMLRHIYLSDLYKDIPKLKKMNEIAGDMAHSLSEALKYVKH
jgi:integrase